MALIRALLFPFIFTAMLVVIAQNANAENPWAARYKELGKPLEVAQQNAAVAEPAVIERAPAAPAPSEQTKQYSITLEQAEQAVANKLVEKGAADSISASITSLTTPTLRAYREPLEMEVDDLAYDAKTGKWNATLYFAGGGKPLSPMAVHGHFYAQEQVPVLKKALSADAVISEDHLTYKEMASNRIRDNAVINAQELIGKSPRRSISAGRAIRADELVSPKIIKKGDRVTMGFSNNQMSIKTLGTALQDGGKGDTIRIRNDASAVVVQAQVQGPGEVAVNPLGSQLMAERSL